jgi:3-methylcrotonyl-CoA carboxylase alpha subunit
LAQDQIVENGHAFEARLYAEDPVDFRPQTGRISHLRFPAQPARVDTGVRQGDTVSIYYDPMIAKLIVHGRDRAEALGQLSKALAETEVAGLVTNQPFLARLAAHPSFKAVEVHTGFIEEHAAALVPEPQSASNRLLALAALAILCHRADLASKRALASTTPLGDPYSPWHAVSGWRLNEAAAETLILEHGDERHAVSLRREGPGYRMISPEAGLSVQGARDDKDRIRAIIGGEAITCRLAFDGATVTLFLPEGPSVLSWIDPLDAAGELDDVGGRLTAPMPGKIISVQVKNGEVVTRGAPLVVLEAMKMEHTIAAPDDGRVVKVHYQAGDLVEEGADLLEFEPSDEA